MKKMYLFCSIIFILSFSAYAQKEAYNWFYGYGQGITWNHTQTLDKVSVDGSNTRATLTGIPMRYEPESVRALIYPMQTNEGCFSLSDESGKLLLYSDGITIYNANHQVMENGSSLSGNSSSTQSGIIIPYPRNREKFIAVTIGISHGGYLAYSVIDMAANNGLGKVKLPKNRSFTLPTGAIAEDFVETITATQHGNGVDYWIVSIQRSRENSRMVAWLLTEDGISNEPITSFIPNLNLSNSDGGYGYLKISPNGKFFVLLMTEKENMMWGEFNNRTGTFTSIQDYFSLTRTRLNTYGGEFSPNNKYLYISLRGRATKIAQVHDIQQLLQGNATPLKTYEVLSNTYGAGAIQLGPDYRMYLTMYPNVMSYSYPPRLYLFDSPNEPLDNKIYALENLSPGSSSGMGLIDPPGTRLGLPSFVSSFFMEARGTSTICVDEEAIYNISTNAQKIEIDFDEGDRPIVINRVPKVKHIFKKPGNYLIKIRPLNSAGVVIQDEVKTVYTTVYSCYLPVNHNLLNAEY